MRTGRAGLGRRLRREAALTRTPASAAVDAVVSVYRRRVARQFHPGTVGPVERGWWNLDVKPLLTVVAALGLVLVPVVWWFSHRTDLQTTTAVTGQVVAGWRSGNPTPAGLCPRLQLPAANDDASTPLGSDTYRGDEILGPPPIPDELRALLPLRAGHRSWADGDTDNATVVYEVTGEDGNRATVRLHLWLVHPRRGVVEVPCVDQIDVKPGAGS